MKIICIGRNYRAHAEEMHSPVPDNPVVFMKPSTALLVNNKPFYLPDFSTEVHYEAEVVLRICKNGKRVQREFARTYWDAVTVGIDFTARDLQRKCKQDGLPWEIAKGFDNAAAVGVFRKAGEGGPVQFSLRKNGTPVQEASTDDLIFDFETLISYVSIFFKLQQGDLLFTGTPSGVGPVQIGDRLEGFIGREKVLDVEIR